MIPVRRVSKPLKFDDEVGNPGKAWLKKNRTGTSRPPAYWNKVKPELKKGFNDLCAYAAMYVSMDGTVDHFMSCRNHRDKAYNWENYRFASGEMNSCKQNADDRILDPYEVGEGWFEIILPSLQLRMTAKIPSKYRAKAEYTLKRLKLQSGEQAIRWRQGWYEEYKNGGLSLEELRRFAPLLADAVQRAKKD